MVTDKQVKKLLKLLQERRTLREAALLADLDEKTARKYRELGRLPSEVQQPHGWRTRADPFGEVWAEVAAQLELAPGLEAQTLFAELQRRYPGRFADGQLRTLQRRVKVWRALYGPEREVFFAQRHEAGQESQSDFVNLDELQVTIQGRLFAHLLYHFVLPYSNWETGSICFSESFESLSEGLQNALWRLGGVPLTHQTDRLSAAVQQVGQPEEFTQRYRGLLAHYGLQGRKTNGHSPHENGDVEQRHHRLKRALEQALLLRGSREFASRAEYARFLEQLFVRLNGGRRERLREELAVLRRLPARRLEAYKRLTARVGVGSTISVERNTYSVPSRLIGERVEVRLSAEQLEVWYGQRRVEQLPRLLGRGKHRVNYRHVIEWLVRKPGAFAHYRYRAELFPSSRFRLAYDELAARQAPLRASTEYLQILRLAARESESGVEQALCDLLDQEQPISAAAVAQRLGQATAVERAPEVQVAPVELASYDRLLAAGEEAA